MKITKRRDQHNEYFTEYEVLDREKINEIVSNLDWEEVKKGTMKEAIDHCDMSGYAYAEINVRDGKVYYGWMPQGTSCLQPDLYLNLASYGHHGNMWDIEDRCLLTVDEMKEIDDLMDISIHGDDAMDYSDAYEAVKEKHNIDIHERFEQYYLEEATEWMDTNDNIDEDLDRIYTSYEEE